MRARIDKGRVADALWWDTVDPYRYVRLDPGDGHDYLIVGGGDHKTGQPHDTAAVYRELEAVARALAPESAVDYRWSGQVAEPSDGLPFIGESAKGQFSATGYGGNGITFGTMAGIMAADWASEVVNPFTEVFSWQRTGLRGGGVGAVLSENIDYPLHRLHDVVSGPRDAVETALAPGSGQVLQVDGPRQPSIAGPTGRSCAVRPSARIWAVTWPGTPPRPPGTARATARASPRTARCCRDRPRRRCRRSQASRAAPRMTHEQEQTMTNAPDDAEPRAGLDPRQTEVPGDLDAPDIVSPVGEEMPVQTHDDVDTPPGEQPHAHERQRAAHRGSPPPR